MLAVKKRIEGQKWYRQGAGAKLLYLSFPWHTCGAIKIHGESIQPRYDMMAYYQQEQIEFYFTTVSLESVAREYFARQQRDHDFLSGLTRFWEERCVAPFRDFLQEWEEKDLSVLADVELNALYDQFRALYLTLWEQAIFLDSFDYESDFLLRDFLQKEGSAIESSDLDLLLYPPHVSFLQKERLRLLALAENIISDREQCDFIKSTENFNDFAERYQKTETVLEAHSRQYHWILNDYALVRRSESGYFYEQLRQLICSSEKLREQRQTRDFLRQLSSKKEEVGKKYQLSQDFLRFTDFLARLGNFRDVRKSYNQMGNAFLRRCVEEWERRFGFSASVTENLFMSEVEQLLAKPRLLADFQDVAVNREKGVFFAETDVPAVNTFFGQDAEELKEYVFAALTRDAEVKGRTAYPGKVQGRVRIIRNQSDFAKMKAGDILVAPNTRPEYAPIMKLAAAIISDEGGLTCHSAILSRELHIPCIVGAQTATIVLKDGEQVAVDAAAGTVKKI